MYFAECALRDCSLFLFSFFSDDKYESLITKAYKFHKLSVKNYKNNIFLVNGASIQGDRLLPM